VSWTSALLDIAIPMVDAPAGTFTRGSAESRDEQPVERVELTAFMIGRAPVLNGEFAAFIEAGCYRDPQYWTPAGWSHVHERGLEAPAYWDDPVWRQEDVPVTGVSWWEALAFARAVGCTLPTEAQWEYCCRGPAGLTYPWGEEEPTLEHANFAPDCEPIDRRPTRPDAHLANVSWVGCLDMVGNFAEWCLDTYRPGYPSSEPIHDPVHLGEEENDHVVRGGCGLHSADYLRCSARDVYHPGLRDNLIGFRCAASAAGAGPPWGGGGA
jgi:iron(II)-dependent oxidoreductase